MPFECQPPWRSRVVEPCKLSGKIDFVKKLLTVEVLRGEKVVIVTDLTVISYPRCLRLG